MARRNSGSRVSLGPAAAKMRVGGAPVRFGGAAIPSGAIVQRLQDVNRPEIILATGQSNMNRSAALNWSPPENLYVWDGSSTTTGTKFSPASHTMVNPAVVFAARMAERDRSRKFYVINISDDGESVVQWLDTASSGVLMWDAITANVEAALAAINETQITRLLWWQGEADIGQYYVWEGHLATVWAQFVAQSWCPVSTPAMMFSINPLNGTYANLIQSQRRFCADHSENWTFIPQGHLRAGTDLDADNVHLTATGMVTSGEAAFAALDKTVSVKNQRELLWTNRTYYVRTDGSDANDGLENTAERAFLTVARALAVVSQFLDLGGYTVTVQLGTGTHARVTHSAAIFGGGYVLITGDAATPSNVIFGGVTLAAPGEIRVSNMVLNATGSYALAASGTGARISALGGLTYGAASAAHLNATGPGARVGVFASYTINGAAPKHVEALQGGHFAQSSAATVTISGTPAFSSAFAFADRAGVIDYTVTPTFSGAATGKRYQADRLSLINANGGASATFFPGDSAGSTATGGQYA